MGTQNEQIQYEAMVSKGVSMRICYWGEDSKWSSGVVSVVLTAPKFGLQLGDLYTFLRWTRIYELIESNSFLKGEWRRVYELPSGKLT